MTLAELRAECERCLVLGRDVQLVVTRPPPRGEHIRLAGRRGPLSKDIACAGDTQTVAWWDPLAILRWLDRE